MPIVNIPDDSLLVFDHNGSLWSILKGESDLNAIGITDENNDEWYIDASNGNTYDLQIQASDDVTKTWFITLEVNMSELIGNSIVIDDSSGIDTSDATAAASDILSGKTAYVNGSKVTGNIVTKTASNLSASGKTVTVPAGYYASQATKDVATGSATAPASISGSSATVSTTTNTLTLSKTVSVTPSVSAGYVASGTAGNSSVSLTASVAVKDTDTITPGTTYQTIAAGTYIKGTQTIKGDANLVAENIKSGVSIFEVNGSYNGPISYSVPTARLATTPVTINSSNKYTINNGSTVESRCAFVVVPTNATNVNITFSTTGNVIAFLNTVNNITTGETPDFSSSYGSRILIDNGTFNYAISSDMNIIYILTRDTSGNSHMPTSIVFTLS